MYRHVLALFLLAFPAFAADHWIEYRIGPFRVVSDAGDKAARDRLNELEQLRHVLGALLGKDTMAIGGPSISELKTVWPVDVVLFSNSKTYAPHTLSKPLIEGGSAMLGAWTADQPLSREMLRAVARMLIDENAGVMPDATETALCDLFSTIKVVGPKVSVGAPLPAGEISGDRLHEWAKLELLVTKPEYGSKVRVYLNNLQGGGDLGMATRNAFQMTPAALNALVDDYVRAGQFEPGSMSGEALNRDRDFIEKLMEKPAVDALLAELAADGKSFPPDSPRGLLAQGTMASYELAIKANPRWGEPHFRMADLQSSPLARIAELKNAATIEPRNVGYWQTLAEAQVLSNLYADAEKSWTAAMKAAPTDAERARIRQVRLDLDEKRAEWEAAEKKRIAEEQVRELQRVKDSAAAEVHAAEAAVNKQAGEFKSNQKPVAWWDDPTGEKAEGKLARVDCLTGGSMRLTINLDGGHSIRLLIRDPKKISVRSGGEARSEARFVCGAARSAPRIRVVYTINGDAKLNTVGDVAQVEFP